MIYILNPIMYITGYYNEYDEEVGETIAEKEN